MFRVHVALLIRSRRADADYATSEREAKRAREIVAVQMLRAYNNKCCVHMLRARCTDADQKPSPSYACVFIYLESEKEGHVQAKYDFELN
jgi:hypothetical protein